MTIEAVKPTEWKCIVDRPGKRIWRRYNDKTDEVEFMEEWFNEVPLKQASQERELFELRGRNDCKPQVVIPQSVVAEAMRDGWYHDEAKWKRWINDSDNSYLRVTRGNV